MCGELQHEMGPAYRMRTVRIALYMFTHVLQENVFLALTDERHTNFTLLHMSGPAVGTGYVLSTGKHHSSGAALSLVPMAPILATDS